VLFAPAARECDGNAHFEASPGLVLCDVGGHLETETVVGVANDSVGVWEGRMQAVRDGFNS
jgi:hypothetical protein